MSSDPIVAQLLSDQAFDGSRSIPVIPKAEIIDLSESEMVTTTMVIPGTVDGSRTAIEDIGPSSFQSSSIKKIQSHSLEPNRIEILVPTPDQRPWNPPEGFMCLLESFFLQARLWFPIPQLLVGYCARRRMAISQLTPSSVKDIVGLLILSTKCRIRMNCWKFEELTTFNPHERAGFFQTKMKSSRKIITGFPVQIRNWQNGYFFVRINDASVYKSDATLFLNWATTIGSRHTVPYSSIFFFLIVNPNSFADKPIKLRGFPPDFDDEARRLKEAGVLEWRKIESSRIKETISWIGRDDWDLLLPPDTPSNSIVPANPMAERSTNSNPENLPLSGEGEKKRKRTANSTPHQAKKPSVGRSGRSSDQRNKAEFDFSFGGNLPLVTDEEKTLELFRKVGGYDGRLPPTEELQESSGLRNIATATTAIAGYVGKSFFGYEKKLHEVVMENKRLSAELKAAKNQLEENKATLGTMQSDLESSSKKIEDANCNAERLHIENSKLQAENEQLRREVENSSLNQEIDSFCDTLEQAREEGRREARGAYRETVARLKSYIESYRRAFKTAITYWQSKAVAEVLRKLLNQKKSLTEAGVAQFERRCQEDAETAEAERIEELNIEDLTL